MAKRPYTIPGRLSDVLALIQVLAFDPDTHRTEENIVKRELGPPASAEGWVALAKEHRELFRVFEDAKEPLSLIARHVQPSDQDKKRQPLTPEFTKVLLETAVDLHDREVQAAERWKYFSPILPSLVTGLLVILSAFVTTRVIHPAQTGRFVQVQGLSAMVGTGVLLDTASGQLCWSNLVATTGITGTRPTSPFPDCSTLH
jgi:hypothetical protein